MKQATLAEFERLYKVNIPLLSELEYYKGLLLRSNEFYHIERAFAVMTDLENSLASGQSIKKKKEEAMDTLLDYIKNTEAYKKFQDIDLLSFENLHATLDTRNMHFTNHADEYFYVSIDMVSANYSILKYLFDTNNELAYNWNELCTLKNIHPAFKESKSFRQIIFGNLNPKRTTVIQKSIVSKIVRAVYQVVPVDDVVYITHDEVIVKFQITSDIKSNCENLQNALREYKSIQTPLKLTPYTVKPIENRKKMFIKNIFDTNGNSQYFSLFGVPGNQFFYFYKKYILNEKIEKRDLIFWNDNTPAIWLMTPDGKEVPEEIISEALSQIV